MPRLDISQTTQAQKEALLKYAAEFYKSEIDNFWKRSLFFWGFIAAAFVAYGSVYGKPDAEPVLRAIACFGLVCSVAWCLLNRGSKYWYEAWEQKVVAIERDVLGAPLFSNIEELVRSGWWGAARYSVSKITIALSDFAVLTWLFLGLKTFSIGGLISPNCFTLIALVGTLLFLAAILIACRSKNRAKV